MRRRFIFAILLIIAMNLLLVSVACAATTGAAPAAKASIVENIAIVIFGSGLVKWFKDGGWAMWPILFVTTYSLAYIIWKFVALMYAKISINSFLSKIIPMIKDKKYAEVEELAKKTRGPVASIVYGGMLKASRGTDAVERGIENASMIEISYLERGFVEMSAGINLAPLLGFLGTVDGMIAAFRAIAAARAVDATIVASGIMIALITTEAGLCVAIPCQLLNNIFVSMVDALVTDMQIVSEKVLDAFIDAEKETA